MEVIRCGVRNCELVPFSGVNLRVEKDTVSTLRVNLDIRNW